MPVVKRSATTGMPVTDLFHPEGVAVWRPAGVQQSFPMSSGNDAALTSGLECTDESTPMGYYIPEIFCHPSGWTLAITSFPLVAQCLQPANGYEAFGFKT